MPAVFVALIALVGGLGSALVGFFVARLVNSGKIETSTADRLWDEASKMRQELRDQVVTQATENTELRAENTGLRHLLHEAQAGRHNGGSL